MIYVVAVSILMGYVLGRSRTFYLFRNGRPVEGAEAFRIYDSSINGLMVDLFGLDVMDNGEVHQIKRPGMRFFRYGDKRVMSIRLGDFKEGAVWIHGRFPYIGAGFKDLSGVVLK